ncbi:maleylacetate reductase [Nonomuraea wenchangensis]|uniref:maleylacetate reductase n=1 Tax=Nonomuraea wenchangensis TaxID=568860 RepID=UPI00340BBE13
MRAFECDDGGLRVVFGTGTLGRLREELDRLGGRRALVLSTPRRGELVSRVVAGLGGAAAGVFDGAVMHTPVEVTEAALARAAELGADSVVSAGGGTTTGLGKAVAHRLGVPHVVLPTTYAGSEVTPVLGETSEGRKTTTTDPAIRPDTVIYDVSLTMGLPWPVTVTSAVNSMAHAVEALYAPGRTGATDRMATGSIAALATGLRRLPGDPEEARVELLYGAYLAGLCLGAVGMGLHHKLCHTLGGSFGLPHAPLHTVVLPYAMDYNAPAAPDAMRAVADALGVADAPAGLQRFARSLGAPADLAGLGFAAADVDRAAGLATERPYPNPRPVTRDGVADLLRRALTGQSIGGPR